MRSLRSRLAAVSLTLAAATIAPAAQAAHPPGFRSVGYQPSWSNNFGSIPYGKLTHINYSFALPNANGTLQDIPEPAKLQQLVGGAHAGGVKVSLAVGGWNNLDGVDIDWECPDPDAEGDNYTALMRQLGDALHSRGKLLTAAVVSEGGTANK